MKENEIHSIVEYIRNADFEFDAADIDEDFPGVLAQYGIVVENKDDLEMLRHELMPLGLQRELAEMAKKAHEQEAVLGVLFGGD